MMARRGLLIAAPRLTGAVRFLGQGRRPEGLIQSQAAVVVLSFTVSRAKLLRQDG
jgi:hypothetical protein